MQNKEKTFKDCELIALRIPAGWVVKHNTFLEEDFLDAQGNKNKFHCDSPDLLLIRQTHAVVNNQYSTLEKDLLLIDAGWKYNLNEENEIDRSGGYYSLNLLRGNFSEGTFLVQEKHNSIEELVMAVNRILKECAYRKWDT